MSAAKHTPGPWTAVAVTSGAKRRDLVYVTIQADRAVGYAAVTHGARDEGEVGGAYAEHSTLSRRRGVTISEAEALENGRLMAAAPELLAACEAFEKLPLTPTCIREVGAIVRAAIARARGGA